MTCAWKGVKWPLLVSSSNHSLFSARGIDRSPSRYSVLCIPSSQNVGSKELRSGFNAFKKASTSDTGCAGAGASAGVGVGTPLRGATGSQDVCCCCCCRRCRCTCPRAWAWEISCVRETGSAGSSSSIGSSTSSPSPFCVTWPAACLGSGGSRKSSAVVGTRVYLDTDADDGVPSD